jgi:hypothetical protein
MKKLLIALVLILALGGVCSAATMTSTVEGKTLLGINYLVWGSFRDASSEARSINTGLRTLRAYGANYATSESSGVTIPAVSHQQATIAAITHNGIPILSGGTIEAVAVVTTGAYAITTVSTVAATTANEHVLFVKAVGGYLCIKAGNSQGQDGTWWAIGR